MTSVTTRAATSERPRHPLWVAVLDQFDRAAFGLLCMAIITYVVAIFAVSKWQLDTLRMGFDPLVYEQPLWNTLHGRLAEQSSLDYTRSAFGQDLFLFHFVLLPFYAIKPTTATLLLLQTLAAAAGAVAVYLLARDMIPGRSLPALLFAVGFLAYLPLQNVNTYEVQPRLFAATFLLFAFWCLTRRNAVGYGICLVFALLSRIDTALVIAALGVYGLLAAEQHRLNRRQRVWFGWLPLFVGLGYWSVAVFLIVPAIAGGTQFSYLQNYDWLGANALDILRTLGTRPGDVLRVVLGADRGQYVWTLLYPLALLPLLAPRVLVVALPPLLLNLLAGPNYAYQRDIFHQYPALITPWLWVAAVLAVAGLARGDHRLYRLLRLRRRLRRQGNRDGRAFVAVSLIGIVLALTLTQQAITNPSRVRQAIKYRDDPKTANRVGQVDVLSDLVPADAALAITNHAALRVPVRRYLYLFPGDKYYDPKLVNCAGYVLGDRRGDNGNEGIELDKLIISGDWQVMKVQGDFQLIHYTGPATRVCPSPLGAPA